MLGEKNTKLKNAYGFAAKLKARSAKCFDICDNFTVFNQFCTLIFSIKAIISTRFAVCFINFAF
jgi:hypothetical protein